MSKKGFTLVELICALAVFSLVMVSIIAMMSTSASTYRKESALIEVQEDAQLCVAQLEELLIDATNVKVNFNHWVITTNGMDYEVDYDTSAKAVTVKVDGKTSEVLCKNVESFKIDGLQFPKTEVVDDGEGNKTTKITYDDTKVYDNRCVVQLNVKNKIAADKKKQEDDGTESLIAEGKNYDFAVSREIYFRNAIEDNREFVIETADGDGKSDDENPIVYEIGRYEVVNMEAQFGMTSVTSVKSVQTDDANYFGNIDLSKNYKSDTDGITAKYDENVISPATADNGLYFTTSTTANNSLAEDDKAIIVKGLNKDGESVCVKLHLKAVALSDDTKVIQWPYRDVNGTCDINSYIKIDGFSPSWYLKCKNGTSDAFNATVAILEDGSNKGSLSGNIPAANAAFSGQINNCKYVNRYENFGIIADPYSTNYLAMHFENGAKMYDGLGMKDKGYNGTSINGGKIKCEIKLKVPGSTSVYSKVYTVVTSGTSLKGI